jgi:hypothetical protein
MPASTNAKAKTKAKSKPPLPRRERQRAARAASLAQRLQAAGLDGDPPADIDAFRNAMARRIHIAINDWQGCTERLCRRLRDCLAPSGACTNAKPLPPMSPEEEARRRAEVVRAFKQACERIPPEEG